MNFSLLVIIGESTLHNPHFTVYYQCHQLLSEQNISGK